MFLSRLIPSLLKRIAVCSFCKARLLADDTVECFVRRSLSRIDLSLIEPDSLLKNVHAFI